MRLALATAVLGVAAVLIVIGAEPAFAATFNVTTTVDEHLTSPTATTCVSPSGCSLRAAIEAADNVGGANTIDLPPGTFLLTLGELQVGTFPGAQASYSTTIHGTGTAANTTIRASNAGCPATCNRVFNVDPLLHGGVTVAIDSLTVDGGRSGPGGLGGAGILAGSPGDSTTLTNCVVSNNQVLGAATNTPGGGIQQIGGNLTVNGCAFDDNSSGTSDGGAIWYQQLGGDAGTLTVTGSTFADNVSNATGSQGGGALGLAGTNAVYGVSGSSFTANQATAAASTGGGGAILKQSGTLLVTSSTFLANSAMAGGQGGALHSLSGDTTARFNRFAGNSTATVPGQALYRNAGNAGTVTADDNWWGTNAGPDANGATNIAVSSWLVLAVTASPASVVTGAASTLTASLTRNNLGADTSAAGHVPDGTPVTFGATLGTVNPVATTTTNGASTSTFTAAHDFGPGTAMATVDGQTVSTLVTVLPPAPPADFDGDGRTDVSVYRPSTGQWLVQGISVTHYGLPDDIPVPADYNGDRTTDIAVYRPSTGQWLIKDISVTHYGLPTDVPVPGDYNGDGRADIAVYRPSTGEWLIKDISVTHYGLSTDVPVPGDYNGDGRTDIALYRPSTGQWLVKDISVTTFGEPTDVPVPGDYNGDRTTDIAVWRPSTGQWIMRNINTIVWGLPGDIPEPGDYNGDLATDLVIWRPSDSSWYTRGVVDPNLYGQPGDVPLPLPSAVRLATAGGAT